MANVLLYTIEFLVTNPGGTFVQGDVLTVYFDDATIATNEDPAYIETTGISAYKNDVLITSGPFINTTPQYVSIKQSNPKFCNGTQLVKFGLFAIYPYSIYYTVPDSFECAVNPETCDLLVIGTPETTPPTTSSSTDGEIKVNAFSSYAIQYKINADFLYGDGQTSNTFSSLAQGGYRIYLRDAKNCGANVYVELKYSGNYGVKYQLEYFGLYDLKTKIEILQRDYSGSITEYTGTEMPLEISLRGEGGVNKFTSMLAVEVKLGILSETDGQWLSLYTNDPDKFQVRTYKDTGSGYELKTVTRLLPFVYQEEHYTGRNYDVYVSATDGLPELKNIDFVQSDGLPLSGTQKLIKIIARCLQYTRLTLPIRVACNIYAQGMDTGDADDPLDQAYVDLETFYLANNSSKISDVLIAILKPFGARLMQWNGVWNIVRVEEMVSTYAYREFDYNGDYVSNGTFNPVLDIDRNGDCRYTDPGNKELQAGYGKITVKYSLGLKPNFLENGNFSLKSEFNTFTNKYEPQINLQGFTLNSPNYIINQTYELIDNNNVALVLDTPSSFDNVGTAFFVSKPYNLKLGAANSVLIKIRYKVKTAISNNLPYVKQRMKVQYGSSYLTGNSTWTSTDTTIVFFADRTGEYIEAQIVAPQPATGTPVAGMDFTITVFHAHPYYADFTTLAGLRALPTTALPLGYKTEVRITGFPSSYMYYYELTEITEAETAYDIVRPSDYNASTNAVQWVLKYIGYVNINESYPTSYDFVSAQFQTNGTEPIDTIIRSTIAEARNSRQLDETLYIGSSANIITTETGLYFDINKILYPTGAIAWNTITTNILSDDLIYSGWLRKADGTRFEYWTRDNISELDLLHGIWLKMVAYQYRSSWSMLRRSIYSEVNLITPLNAFNDVVDGNKKYIPVSMVINDKENTASCELHEFNNPYAARGGDFSIDFNNNDFNVVKI